jgi:sugar lactone lactonase YvrE
MAIEGGRVDLVGRNLPVSGSRLPEVRIGDSSARIVSASKTRFGVIVPAGLEGGRAGISVEGVSANGLSIEVAATIASGLHQVDNPVFDADGNLYVTYSGARGEELPVSIFRVTRDGARENFVAGIVNPTSMTFDPAGRLLVSSRFDGTVYSVDRDGSVDTYASELGVACGLAFGRDGMLYVGDRSGTVFRVNEAGRAERFAALPASIAAFHLAFGPDGALFVTGPTLSPYDHVYRIEPDGKVGIACSAFGRPQGLAVDDGGRIYVVEALAGASGLYRLQSSGAVPEPIVAAPSLVGVALDPSGGLIVASNDTAYRFSGDVQHPA